MERVKRKSDAFCCRQWEKARNQLRVEIKVITRLGINTPRLVLQYYEKLKAKMGEDWVHMATMDQCPCESTPNPAAYRALVERVYKKYPKGDASPREMETIALEVAKDFGMEDVSDG